MPALSSDAYAALSAYRFPGNVRELAHAIEHAVVLAGGGEITLDHLPAVIAEAAPARIPVPAVARPRRTARRRRWSRRWSPPLVSSKRFIFVAPLAATGGKRVKAAEMLGISRKSLWEKLRMYELEEAGQ